MYTPLYPEQSISMPHTPPRELSSILITGASSGIGRALAIAYAKPGIHLSLSGRNQQRLNEVAEECRLSGAKTSVDMIDVTDMHEMLKWITTSDNTHPLDLVIANAGISAGGGDDIEDNETVRDIFSVNLAGVLNTVLPSIEVMRIRKSGQIAIISSMAGFRGLPSAPAYSASKAAVKAWGEGLRGNLKDHGIKVNVVCPGFVKSRISDKNSFKMPMLMSAEKAAGIIIRGLKSNKPRIAFPWPIHFFMWLIALLPPFLSDQVLNKAPRKQ